MLFRSLERFDPVRVPAVRVLDLRHAGSDFSGRQAVGTGPCGAPSDRPDGSRFVEPCPPQPTVGREVSQRWAIALGGRAPRPPAGRPATGVQPAGDWSSRAPMSPTSASVLPSSATSRLVFTCPRRHQTQPIPKDMTETRHELGGKTAEFSISLIEERGRRFA